MRGTRLSGCGLLIVALVAAILIVVGLYAWDSNSRAAEAALRPAPVAPLAPVPQTPNLPIVSASPVLVTPAVAAGNADAAAGQQVFARLCTSCHPNASAGIGPAVYGPQFAQRYPDDTAIAAVVRQGRGGMPAFPAAQLSDADLANVIAYLRGLSSGAVAPEATPTPRPRQRGG